MKRVVVSENLREEVAIDEKAFDVFEGRANEKSNAFRDEVPLIIIDDQQ